MAFSVPKIREEYCHHGPHFLPRCLHEGAVSQNFFLSKNRGGGGVDPQAPFLGSANELSIVIYCNFKVSDFSANRSPAVRHSVAANINLCSLTVLLLVSRRLRSHFILTTSAH